MGKSEKLDKVCKDFSSLQEGQQDYILGIAQALAFAAQGTNPPAAPGRCRTEILGIPLEKSPAHFLRLLGAGGFSCL
ncbi:MAG: hypothetical protein LBR23_08025 [Spirochaetaceae bacterium]|nr:hypothetical protein [Spirochaetaceae bacterium]